MNVIFSPSGRLGNAIFRYFACILFLKENPTFIYKLHDKYDGKTYVPIQESTFYQQLEEPLKQSCIFEQYYQFDSIYLTHKQYILDYIQEHKHEHYIQTDEPIQYLMRDVIDPITLPSNKLYDVVIHIRLGDFNGRPDFIEYEYMEKVFDTMLDNDELDGRNAICIEPPRTKKDKLYLKHCLEWFKERNIEITCESNSLFVDFSIMRQAKLVVSSMSTLCWTAIFLSESVKKCYMPDYDFSFEPGRQYTNFKTPIQNTYYYTK